jgi:hypothetical protein
LTHTYAVDALAPSMAPVGETVYWQLPPCVTVRDRPPIATTAVRGAVAVFSAMSSATVPLPVPLPPDATPIHAAPDDTVQSHAAPVVTSTLADDAAGPTDTPILESAIVQVLPACATEIMRPAAVIVPEREKPLVFCMTLKFTVPLPLPDPPDVIVIHGVLVVALQAQPAAPPTVSDAFEDAEDKETAVGATLNVHATAPCTTFTVCPAIVKVPVRGDEPVLAATSNVTVPPPLPVAPPEIDIHGAELAAVHGQELPA